MLLCYHPKFVYPLWLYQPFPVEITDMATKKPNQLLALNLILASTLAFAEGDTKKGMKYMAFAIESPDYKSTIAALDDAATADDDQDVDADNTDDEDEDAADTDLEDDTTQAASFKRMRRTARRQLAEADSDSADDDGEEDEEEEPKPSAPVDAEEARMKRARFNMRLMAELDKDGSESKEPTDGVDDADGDSDDDLDEEEIQATVRRAFGRSKKPAASKKAK